MFGGKSGLIIFTLLIGLTLAAFVIPAALADEDYSVTPNNTYQRANSDIIVHMWVNVTDKPMGNVFPTGDNKWAHLVFTYENTGSTTQKGSIQMDFIDTDGNVYTPADTSISNVDVPAHSTSGRTFIEVPISRNATLAKLHIYQGTNPAFHVKDQYYDLVLIPRPSATPVTPTTAPTATQATGCLGALLPFGLLSSIGIAGIAVKKYGLNK